MLTLFHAHTGRHRFASLAGGVVACVFALAVGSNEMERTRFHTTLQKLADDAALAGVSALAGGKGAVEQEARHQAAFGASKSIIRDSGRSDLKRSIVTLSESNLKVSVALAAVEPAPWWNWLGAADHTVSVASTAHYTAADPNGRSSAARSAAPLAPPAQPHRPLANALGPSGSTQVR